MIGACKTRFVDEEESFLLLFGSLILAARKKARQRSRMKLKDPQRALTTFLPRVEHLGAKLGPILFQLPPKWRVNYERLKALLPAFPYVFELRDRTGITPDIDELLSKLR